MPLTGMIVWTGIGIAGAVLPQGQAVLATYIGAGMIFYLAIAIGRMIGEDVLARQRKGNLFDKIFLSACAMAFLVYAIGIPFHRQNLTSVPLSVGVLSGLMWLPFSVMIGHWVGFFHAIARTVLLVAAWYMFPTHRFVALPLVIVAVYLVSILALQRRWHRLQAVPHVST